MSDLQDFDRRYPRSDAFARRHLGPDEAQMDAMLETVGLPSVDELIRQTVPASVRSQRSLGLPAPVGEAGVLADLGSLAAQNRLLRSYLGLGYHGTLVPPVIQRNVLENPGWYTQYTPYQPEIAQGRLEALLNFQTMVIDLTGLDIASASLLDEATAAAEAMALCHRVSDREGGERGTFVVAPTCHPQTLAVIQTRAEALGLRVEVAEPDQDAVGGDVFGLLLQYPDTHGAVADYRALVEAAHAKGTLVVVASDLLALTLLTPPGEWGADVVVGNSQRFGVPLGYGGPHAAFMAAREVYARQLPGRLVGVSVDAHGQAALRLALQTREQHIRRDKATSNICTAQALLAIVAASYAVYHGPDGLRRIAERVRALAALLAAAVRPLGWLPASEPYFDTLHLVRASRGQSDMALAGGEGEADDVVRRALAAGINLRRAGHGVVVALDETATVADVAEVAAAFGGRAEEVRRLAASIEAPVLPPALARTSAYLTHPVFNRYHSETEMLRYLHRLESRDLSLTHSMIPLGSCTMKLNATAEMVPISYPGFAGLHPFVPVDQAEGYAELHRRLAAWLTEITGMNATSLQPNAGAQGEFTGLLVIRAYHRARNEVERNVCLIPVSAHGTNPASAAMAGMEVVVVACDEAGNVEVADLEAKARAAGDRLAALMITYPSTHGVFETAFGEICRIIHAHGGQVYMDGANMNALVGLVRPGEVGVDVCHLNLHKTFCIPHGGGGPGMGPICVASHLAPYLPGHPLVDGVGGSKAIGPVAAAPWGSPLILAISYAYIAMMGPDGLRQASEVAILNANYVAARLAPHYPVLYTGENGRVAHECILDLRHVKASAGIEPVDVAKRLMDYGFHAPTMSWPVAGTLMVEPTESESKPELDRFCDAMIAIRAEIAELEAGHADRAVNVLKGAPHTARMITDDAWDKPYSRAKAAFPAPWLHGGKFWPSVARINDQYGDRNLMCECPPVSDYAG